MDRLQRVLNAAARVITGTRKFDRSLGQTLHDQLHWLDVRDRVLIRGYGFLTIRRYTNPRTHSRNETDNVLRTGLDHNADAETHERFAEVNHALSGCNDGQRRYCQVSLLQPATTQS